MAGIIVSTFILTRREIVKWVNRRSVLVVSIITPIFWIALFGKSFNLYNLVQTSDPSLSPAVAEAVRTVMTKRLERVFGTPDYFTYVATGMLAVFSLFQSMFGAVGVVFDRRIGYLTRLLASPIPRFSIFASKVLGTLFRITVLSLVLLAIAYPLGLHLKPGITIVDFVMAWIVLMLMSLGLSSIFTGMAFNISHQEVLFALANLINLPLMFTSSALFPIDLMPNWLRTVAQVNPITHAADLVRYYLVGKPIDNPTVSTAYLTILTLLLLVAGYMLARNGVKEA
ncbi:ABC transporter permease [Aeropyrum camini]|uniref:ABC transporter permease n=1 Tax=Aeropyrum camini SY1 = JCM 12091 TaxID=1198449 RepID=U3TF43_9CREN|nr:ABC transporter permease [Aeropyrum camini]BAN91086.1 ABC transporter permease [Aeropyrum camini SY1 = JCM 12091]